MRRPSFARSCRRLTLVRGLAAAALLVGSAFTAATPTSPCTGTLSCERAPVADGSRGAADALLPTDKPHLIEFMSANCPSCSRMAPVLAELEGRCTRNDGTILRVDVDSPVGEALSGRYRVRRLPTFLSLDAEGKEVERHEGETPRGQLAIALAELRGEACPSL